MDFFKIKNLTEKTADVYIYGEIVSEKDGWFGSESDVAPEEIQQMLETVKGKDLNIFINSPGGSVFAGLAIYNLLKRHEGFKTVHVDGVAASIASIIAFAGNKIVVPKNAFLMIHSPWVQAVGNATDLRKQADDLDRIEEGLLAIYQENIKEDANIEEIQQMVKNETWLNGEKAANFFNVETGEELKAVACMKGNYFNSFKQVPEEIEEAKAEKENTTISNLEKSKLYLEIDLI